MKEGLPGWHAPSCSSEGASFEEARLHVARWIGFESPSARRLSVVDHAEVVEQTAAPPDADGLRGLVARVARYRQPVRAVIESMNGARFVHDTLEELGWEVLVADAQKVKGWPRWRATIRRGRAREGTESAGWGRRPPRRGV
jgi:hypothetical protein